MRILIAFSLLILMSTLALAQASQQKFVPFTVTEQDAKNLRSFLDEQPMKIGLPILQWMERLETQALVDAAKAKEEPPKQEDK